LKSTDELYFAHDIFSEERLVVKLESLKGKNHTLESLVELVEIVLLFQDVAEKVESFLDEILANDLEDLVLLQGFLRDVERKILRIDNTPDEVGILWNKIFTIIHDENAADIKFDVITLLLRLEKVKRSTLG
jgi:hypothetical protein